MRRGREESPKGIRGRTAGLALLVWMGLSLSLKDPGKGQAVLNLIASFARFDLARLLMLPGLYFLFRKAAGFRSPEPRRWARLIPACFFAGRKLERAAESGGRAAAPDGGGLGQLEYSV